MTRFARVLLFAVLVLTLMPFHSAAQSATGTIVFRPYICPYGYDAQFYPQVCRLYADNSSAALAGDQSTWKSATIGEDGAIFTLQPGRYVLSAGVPGDFSYQLPARCWADDTEVDVPVSLAAGQRIECELIIFPVSARAENPVDEIDATLTIRARYCDPAIERTSYHTECFDQPAANQEFTVRHPDYSAGGTTDQEGNLRLKLPDFTYSIDLSGPLAETPVWRFCSTAEHPGIPILYPIQFYRNSASITCDIYLLPKSYDLAHEAEDEEVGFLEVHYRRCPPGYTGSALYRDCHEALMSFAAINVAGGSEASTGRGYTGLDGNVTFRVLPDEYQFPPEILGEADDHITVFCAGKDELQDPLEYPVDVVAKDHIVCDLYLLPAALNGRTGSDPLKSVVASLTVHSCDTSGCATPVEGFAMRFRTEPSNNVRLVTDANGYAEAAFSYEAAGGVLIVPEFNDFDRHTPVGQADISCVSSGVELPRTALESPSANQMFALKTAEVADIDCTILLNVDLVEI